MYKDNKKNCPNRNKKRQSFLIFFSLLNVQQYWSFQFDSHINFGINPENKYFLLLNIYKKAKPQVFSCIIKLFIIYIQICIYKYRNIIKFTCEKESKIDSHDTCIKQRIQGLPKANAKRWKRGSR